MQLEAAVVGMGTMGQLVVQAWRQQGHRVGVFDVQPQALQQARQLGAQVLDSPAELARQAPVVVIFLPGPAQVTQVVAGPQGLLEGAQPGQILVDMGTTDPATTRRMGQLAAQQGVGYLDAPVLGRPGSVGRWVLPVGGDEALLDRVRPWLLQVAKEVVLVGPLGAGHTLKLLNNLMFGAINAITAEVLAISERAGLDPARLYGTIANSEAATVSGLFRESGRRIVQRDFTPAFTVDLLCKDNALALQMAREAGVPALLASTVQTLNEWAQATGHGAEDTSAVVKVYEQLLAGGKS